MAIAADFWPCRLDAAQLETALLDLVINARDAKGGTLTIDMRNVDIGRTMRAAAR
jgi:two-component system, cell cycle sensor histidine kinase and response regulator CckA